MKHTEYIIPIGEEAKDFDEIFIGVLRKHKELIRCKDCKFLRFTGTVWKCQNRSVMMLCEMDDFCSRAERRGG